MPLIALVGMPGSGKSTVGSSLARRLGLPFADSDAVIERQLQCSIRQFFQSEGETRFREVESETLAALIGSAHGVVATGGGAVLSAANREALRRSTVCVYLRATPEDLFKRLRHDTRRPLLQVADPLARLRVLHASRDPLYRDAARFTIEIRRPSLPSLVNMIMMQLELAGSLEAVAGHEPPESSGEAP